MTDEARKAWNAYMREYRRKNKDKVKAISDKYWENRSRKAGIEGALKGAQ